MEKWWTSALVSLALVGSCARQAPTETLRDNTVSSEAVVAPETALTRSSGPQTLGRSTVTPAAAATTTATNDALYEPAFAETRWASSSDETSLDETSFDDTLECCKICHKGKACGDTCIARDKTCHKGPGCACDG